MRKTSTTHTIYVITCASNENADDHLTVTTSNKATAKEITSIANKQGLVCVSATKQI